MKGYNMPRTKNTMLHIPFNAPLNKEDTPTQTYGCRAVVPDNCLNADTNYCAFRRDDCICIKPSRSWKRQFYKLGGKDEC